MVLQSTGQISWSNFSVEYNVSGEVGCGNLRGLDKRLPQSTPVSSSNFYGLYRYPITSNVLYLEASNATSYSGSGSIWTDLSGIGNNFTLPASGITWNSAGYFAASASHNGIMGPSNNLFSISTEHTLEFVAQARTSTVNSFIWLDSTAATGQNRMINIHLPWTDNVIYYDVRGAGDATSRLSVATTTNTNPNGGIRHFVFRCRSTPTPNRSIFVNGTSIADSGANSTSTLYTWGGNSYLLTNSLGDRWQGDLYYLRIYNRALTDTEITNVYTTMKTKYGI